MFTLEAQNNLGVDTDTISCSMERMLFQKRRWTTMHQGKRVDCICFPGCCVGAEELEADPGVPHGGADVMCLIDWPEHNNTSQYVIKTWEDDFRDLMESTGQTGFKDWYFTPFIKMAPWFYDKKEIPQEWVKTFRPIFERELSKVHPRYILCFGTQIAKVLLRVSKMSIEAALGRTYSLDYTFEDGNTTHYEVIVLPNLKSFNGDRGAYRTQELARHQMRYFRRLLDGKPYFNPRHIVVSELSGLKQEVDRIIQKAATQPRRRIIAVDMEWEGDYPDQTGAHLLTVQFSSWPGEACTVVLQRHDGTEFSPSIDSAVVELNRLLTPHDTWAPRVGGHFLRADLPWLIKLGITGSDGRDIRYSYAPPRELKYCRCAGGWDTSLMYHAYNEKETYGLKYLAALELDAPRYEIALNQCITTFLTEHKMSADSLHGFGCIPDEVLHPYGAWDADVTRCLAELCMFGSAEIPYCTDRKRRALLDDDMYHCSNWKSYWLAHRASLGFLDIEMTGILLDKDRFRQLSEAADEVYDVLLQDLRSKSWPDFNPKSSPHKQGFLFGRQFARTVSESGVRELMPEGASSLNLPPQYATKTRRLWESQDVVDEDGNAPSTDKTVLDLLAQKSKTVGLLRDVCRLSTMLSSPLSTPIYGKDTNGEPVVQFQSGLYAALHEDGAIHSNMRTLCSTGRASSTNPNMQNTTGKSAEPEVMRIMGYKDEEGEHGDYIDILEPHYIGSVHSVLRARPDYVFMEPDFTGAELAVTAWMSNDTNMIEHVRRNALPESDPEYYDMHSHVAVKAFRLSCDPTKKGLASIHKKHLRIAAKAIAFGTLYGRGAKAIAIQCRAQGIPLTDREAEDLITTFYAEYPKVKAFLTRCKERVSIDNKEARYVESLFGRKRRFPPMTEKMLPRDMQAAEQREACNAPIQSTVADAMNVAIYNFIAYRYRHPEIRFHIVMQIHDALLLEVHKDDASFVYNTLIKECMVDNNPIVCKQEDGTCKVYHFATDADVSVHWGEELTEEVSQSELGCSLGYIIKPR